VTSVSPARQNEQIDWSKISLHRSNEAEPAARQASTETARAIGERSECLKDFVFMSSALHRLDELIVD
jgi:hypothetical protein